MASTGTWVVLSEIEVLTRVKMTTDEKLDDIIARLDRIEKRQIKTTALVEEVQEHEAPVVGSFATVDTGKEK